MRRLALITAATALLIAPAAADAKGMKWVKVCGLDECSKTLGKDWDYAQHPLIFPPKVMSDGPDDDPEVAAPWYSVKVALWRKERARSIVAPEIKYVGGRCCGGYVWQKLNRKELGTYLFLTEGLVPNPADTMPGEAEGSSGALAHTLKATASAAGVVLRGV
ncbi:MAG TPA: hypothetical protein VD766_03070 [Solirubrobacterales bacterium]|nr:hypothetical protein [Solirubrobacterales bacterium]